MGIIAVLFTVYYIVGRVRRTITLIVILPVVTRVCESCQIYQLFTPVIFADWKRFDESS